MADRIIDILLRIKSDIMGAKAAETAVNDLESSVGKLEEAQSGLKDSAEDATAAVETGAKEAAAAVDKHVDAVESLTPAYNSAGEEARGAGSEIEQSSRKIDAAGDAAAEAEKKIEESLARAKDGVKNLAAQGTKTKVIGDVLRNIANLNFQGAASSLTQLGASAKAFVGVATAGIATVTVWANNIRNWSNASEEIKKADLAGIAQGIITGVDAAGASFDRLSEKIRAAAEEMKSMRDAKDTLIGADRELETKWIEVKRQESLFGVDDEEKRKGINEKYDAKLAERRETWATADANTAINRNAEDADAKRQEADRLRNRVSQNSRSSGVLASQQTDLNNKIGEFEDQSFVSEVLANRFFGGTAPERAGEYQKQFDELGEKRMALIEENRQLVAQIKRLESEAETMETIGDTTLNKKLTATTYATQAGQTARADAARRAEKPAPANAPATSPAVPAAPSSGSKAPGSAGLADATASAQALAGQSQESGDAMISALQTATETMRRQGEEIKILKEKIRNLPTNSN